MWEVGKKKSGNFLLLCIHARATKTPVQDGWIESLYLDAFRIVKLLHRCGPEAQRPKCWLKDTQY